MKKIFLLAPFFGLMLATISASAQKQLKGKVKNLKDKPIAAASINLVGADGSILSFTRSDDNGQFTLSFTEENKDLKIEASVIGYAKQTLPVGDLTKNYELILSESEINLKTVVVKNRPQLTANGDTLNYKTSDFADKQDRTIGDVLKKMPGITVEENGKVLYNGKGISNLYLDKDNVLDDKYGIATKSIPHGAVEKIQVIENDQPIKMLRKNNMSDDVALNLVIKDDAKLKVLGDAKAGLGAPERFDAAVNAMLLKKKVKFINNVQGNNIGRDPGVDLTSFNLSDFQRRVDNEKPTNFLSAGAANVPTLPQTRSLFNKAGMGNFNHFYKFSEELQVKGNLSYLYDQRDQVYNKFSETYLPNQTIKYNEIQQNAINPQKLQGKFNLNENAETHYLNNTLTFDYARQRTSSMVTINGLGANQRLTQETFDLFNEFNYRKKLKSENTLNFYSFLNRTTQPEFLNIRPGLNENILNNGQPYAGLDQYVRLPTLYTNNYLSFGLVNGNFVQTYKTGFSLQKQNFDSELYRIQNNQDIELAGNNMTNTLAWNKNKVYAEGSYEYTNDKLKIGLNLPLSHNRITYQDTGYQLDQEINKFFLNPSLNVKYQTGTENYVSANYNYKNDLGGLDDVYRGTVLKNYRSLFANDAPISERQTQSIGATYNFRKAMQMFFFNLNANYSTTTLNTISSYSLTNNTLQRIVLPLENEMNALSVGANMSKYLFKLKATVSAGIAFSTTTFDQLQNGNLFPFRSETMIYKAGIEAKLTKFMNWSYTTTFTDNTNKADLDGGLSTNFKQLRHGGNLTATAFKSLFITLSGEHIFTHQDEQANLSYLFSDLNLRYRFLKYKTDLELGMTNLANVKKFEAINATANSLTSGTYYIPGRVAMVKATFNF